MKFLASIFAKKTPEKTERKSIKDFQEDLLFKQGREQFKKLLKLGQMPIAFL